MALDTVQHRKIPAGKPATIRLDMIDDLDETELVSSVDVPTGPAGISFGVAEPNAAEYRNPIRGNRKVAAGKAAFVTITNSTPGIYDVVIEGTTSISAPGPRGFAWNVTIESV